MQVFVEITSSIERKLSIGVPSTVVDKIFEEKLRDVARKARINGFRPGKIPISEIKRRYGKSIRRESISEIIDTYYQKALQDQEISPVGMPKIERVIDEPGSDFKFEAVVEVWPEISLPGLSGLEIKVPETEIDEASIDKVVERLRAERATHQTPAEDYESQLGDILTIDFVGKIAGESEPFEGGTATDYELTLGKGGMIEGFESGLVGHKKGDKPRLDLIFPDDYSAEDLRSKAVVFEVEIKEIQRTVLPEVNEAFVKACEVESGDIQDLREQLRKNMERERALALASRLKSNVAQALVEKVEFTVPNAMIGREAERMRDAAISNFGGDPERMKGLIPIDMFKEQSEKSVRQGILFHEYIKKLGVEATEAQVNERLSSLVQRYDDPEGTRRYFESNQSMMDSIKSQVTEDVLVERIKADATCVPEVLSFDELVDRRTDVLGL